MLLSMGAVFAFIFRFLFLVSKNSTGKTYDRDLAFVHFWSLFIGGKSNDFFQCTFLGLAGIA